MPGFFRRCANNIVNLVTCRLFTRNAPQTDPPVDMGEETFDNIANAAAEVGAREAEEGLARRVRMVGEPQAPMQQAQPTTLWQNQIDARANNNSMVPVE